MPVPRNLTAPVLVALCALALAAAFLIDILSPPAVATGAIYAAIVLLGLWLSSRTAILSLAATTSLVAVLGFLASPGLSLASGPILTNCALAVMAVWVVALLVIRQRRSTSSLQQSEVGLREREARLQAILDTAPESIVAIDRKGTIGSFSPAAEALFG